MHFMWADLIDNPFVAAIGMQLTKIDRMMEKIHNRKERSGVWSVTGSAFLCDKVHRRDSHGLMKFKLDSDKIKG